MKKEKAVISPKNNDKKYFKRAFVEALNHKDIGNNPSIYLSCSFTNIRITSKDLSFHKQYKNR